jgi:hypothetical protein
MSSSTSLDGESRVRCDSACDRLRIVDLAFGRSSDGFDAGLGSRFRWLVILSSSSIIVGTCGPAAKFRRTGERVAGEVLER